MQLIEEQLESYHLKISNDIFAASVMIKLGRLIDVEHQLCIVHGIHLAVTKILYKKKSKRVLEQPITENIAEFETNDIDEEVEFSSPFDIIQDDDDPVELTGDFNLFELIETLVVIKFHQSATKNDEVLQRYVKEDFNGKELILDCKTRWNTLFIIVERFYK